MNKEIHKCSNHFEEIIEIFTLIALIEQVQPTTVLIDLNGKVAIIGVAFYLCSKSFVNV